MSWRIATRRRREVVFAQVFPGRARARLRFSVHLTLLLVYAAAAAPAARAAPDCAGPRLGYDYPIVLKGVPVLRGQSVGRFAAFRRVAAGPAAARWERVAVQVDEVNAHGDFVLAEGLPFTRGTDDGIFDDNDEIVFDGAALGDDFVEADVPPELRGVTRWHAGFCRAGHRLGDLLVVNSAVLPPWRGPAQVRFDAKAGEVSSDLYDYKFSPGNPVLLGEVLLRHGAAASPVISSTSFLMPLETPFYMPNMTVRDADFTSSIESWQSGPLRTIVAVGVKYSAFLSLFKLHLFSELVFYRNRFEIPTVIEFIFDPSRFLAPGSGLAYSLRFPPGHAWEIESNLAALPAKDADELVESGPRATSVDSFYAKGSRPEGSFLVQVRVDPKARAQVPPPFLLREADFRSEALAEHWPWLRKIPGDLGVYLDFSQIRKGVYDFGLDLLLSPKAHESFTDYGSVDSHWQVLPSRK